MFSECFLFHKLKLCERMELRVILCCFLVSWFSFCFADNIEVTIRGETSIAKTDDNFICATLDWWPNEKCDYNDCSWIESGILNMDLKSKVLSNAIKGAN
ncbi:hypothetical protein FEM48_Zijuj10G0094400 [Ziziphus jujuba var. spinosa]|uniref:Heparanase-like protein 3 n=1 Tax=Ziziphus jujuba var. spinosa TaxID=714518 RepID=A0A978UMK5_ZIZJJ|nr:hypothetical protein FEM48_Zijuj10G0094400 [Ziziphus jujuba var. spinosa]